MAKEAPAVGRVDALPAADRTERNESSPAMSGADFAAWLEAEGLTLREAQEKLGVGSRTSLSKYKEEGAPLTVALACSAISAGLGPWSLRIKQERAGA
jgi:hypothetical protein